MDGKERLPNQGDESEAIQEIPLPPRSPADCPNMEGNEPHKVCSHGSREDKCPHSGEFSCGKKHPVCRKCSEELPSLDPSLETAQGTTITRKVEEKKVPGKPKKGRRGKKKTDKSKPGSANAKGDTSSGRVRTGPKDGIDSSQRNPDMEISPEEIHALIKRLNVVPKLLPNPKDGKDTKDFLVPEYDTIFKVSYGGHRKPYHDYCLQSLDESFDEFLDQMASLGSYFREHVPSSEHTPTSGGANVREKKDLVTLVSMDELFSMRSGLRKPPPATAAAAATAKHSEEGGEPEEDRYLRYQRSLIVGYLEKVKEDTLALQKVQRMKEVEMLKQIGLNAQWRG